MKRLIYSIIAAINIFSVAIKAQQRPEERLNFLFAKLQQPIDKDFKGAADAYRLIYFQEIESFLMSSQLSAYNLPINGQTKCHNETFLYRSAAYNLPMLTKKLLSMETSAFMLGKAFWKAACQGHATIAHIFLNSSLANVHMITWQDSNHLGTPLHNAAYNGHKEVVQRIVDYAISKNQKNILTAEDSSGESPLDYALANKQHDIVELLTNALKN